MASDNAQHTIRDELQGVIGFVAVIWGVFLVDWLVPYDLRTWGLTPRTTGGLVGILTMPFLHEDWRHITGNTLPLFILLALLAGSRANSWLTVIGIGLLGGGLLWLVGRHATHIGASALIFGLVAYLIVAGLLERRLVPLGIAAIVGIFYGGSLLSGIIPRAGSNVSWDGHLCGAIAGGAMAVLLARKTTAAAAGQNRNKGPRSTTDGADQHG